MPGTPGAPGSASSICPPLNLMGQGSAGAAGSPMGGLPSQTTTPPASGGAGTSSTDATSQTPGAAQPGQTTPAASLFGTPGMNGSPLAMQPTGPVSGPVLGGFLTGVGSTVDRTSLKVYDTGTNYNQWEFIWNPIEDQARAVQQGLGQAGASVPNLLGQPGASSIFGGAASPFGGAAASPNGSPGAPGSPAQSAPPANPPSAFPMGTQAP